MENEGRGMRDERKKGRKNDGQSFKSGYVVILGAPNTGKSTLLNCILKEKLAIVTSKPQTTRQKFLGIYSTKEAQILFLDTPGVHQSPKLINQYMMHEVRGAIKDADILCYLVGVDVPISQDLWDLYLETKSVFPQKASLLVINKIDLPFLHQRESPEDLKNKFFDLPCYSISAVLRKGVDELLNGIIERLPFGPAYYPIDQLTDKHLRYLASEIIREKAMGFLHQEVPYALAVEIDAFKEDEKLTKIKANLIVEQNSQKGIVIGEAGKMIKEIGSQARTDIETLVGTKVFLELHVKVDKNWTKNPAKMKHYGYGGDQKLF